MPYIFYGWLRALALQNSHEGSSLFVCLCCFEWFCVFVGRYGRAGEKVHIFDKNEIFLCICCGINRGQTLRDATNGSYLDLTIVSHFGLWAPWMLTWLRIFSIPARLADGHSGPRLTIGAAVRCLSPSPASCGRSGPCGWSLAEVCDLAHEPTERQEQSEKDQRDRDGWREK